MSRANPMHIVPFSMDTSSSEINGMTASAETAAELEPVGSQRNVLQNASRAVEPVAAVPVPTGRERFKFPPPDSSLSDKNSD